MPSSTSGSAHKDTASKWLDNAMKVLSGLVIPLIVWGVKLEVKNAIQDERIAEIQEDLDKLSDVTNAVQKNSLALVRLEGKLDNVDEKIDEVKKLLRSRDQ
jgi:hypothetical protein